jgi:hypothetical protein
MTAPGSGLRDLMDEAVRESVEAIRVDPAAARLEGRRRRTKTRLWASLSVAAVAVVATAGLSAIDGEPFEPGTTSSGTEVAEELPVRLDYTYWDDPQPSITGPLAGLIERNGDGVSGWWSVSPEGHLWRLSFMNDVVPSLSPDGTHLGSLPGLNQQATYVITNQVDGTKVEFPQIGGGFSDARVEGYDHAHRYFVSMQTPSFWSSDGTQLLIRMGTTNPDSTESVAAGILGVDGSLTTVPLPDGAGGGATPVGWVGNHYVVLAGSAQGRAAPTQVWLVDTTTQQVAREFTVRRNAGFQQMDQWLGSVWNGTKLAMVSPGAAGRIRFYAMSPGMAGQLVGTLPSVPLLADTCPLSSSSSDLYVPTLTSRDGDSAILMRANGGVAVRADPRLDVVCSVWARTALEGQLHTGWTARFFGANTSWLSWHWREVAGGSLGGITVLTLAALIFFARSRRRLGRVGGAIQL